MAERSPSRSPAPSPRLRIEESDDESLSLSASTSLSERSHSRAHSHAHFRSKRRSSSRMILAIEEDLGEPVPLTILYGSQLGNSEHLAQRLFSYAVQTNLVPKLTPLTDYDPTKLKSEVHVAIIMSTILGSFPDSVKNFWTLLGQMEEKSLEGLKYALLGLGNSQMGPNFCLAGRTLDKRLRELGAEPLLPYRDSDELSSDGHETAFEKFHDELWQVLKVKTRVADLKKHLPYTVKEHKSKSGAPKGFQAVPILSNDLLTPTGYPYQVYRMRVAMKSYYSVAGHVAVYPQNPSEAVDSLLRFLQLNGSSVISITPAPGAPSLPLNPHVTLREVFETYLDWFGRPNKQMVRYFASRARSERERSELAYLCSNDREWALFYNESGVTIAEFFMTYSRIARRLSLSEIISIIPPIKPRLYCISSHPQKHKGVLEFVYSIRQSTAAMGKPIKGLASHYLANLKEQDYLMISTTRASERSRFVNMEERMTKPLVLVATGSAIGALLPLLEERRQMKLNGTTLGPMIIFYGCRNEKKDLLFTEEFKAYQEAGVYTRVVFAFALDQPEKIYVQHRIRENTNDIFQFLTQGGSYHYIGIAGNVPNDVELTVRDALKLRGYQSDAEAAALIETLKKEDRWTVNPFSAVSPTIELTKEDIMSGELLESEVQAEIMMTGSELLGGTFRRVAEWVIDLGNRIDRFAFLVGYRRFGTPKELFGVFIDKWNSILLSEDDGQVVFQQRKLLNFLDSWVRDWVDVDFRGNPEVTEELEKFGNSLNEYFLAEARLLQEKVAAARSPPTPAAFKIPEQRIVDPDVMSKSTLCEQNPKEVAAQLTLLDQLILKETKPLEFLSFNWTKKEKWDTARQVSLFAHSFNQLSNYVPSVILTRASRTQQIAAFAFFVKLAKELLHLNNFNSLVAVISGLNNYVLTRLTELRKDIKENTMVELKKIQDLTSFDRNFNNLRTYMERLSGPFIPYVGLVLKDITFAEEGNPTNFENGLINFGKMKQIHQIISKAILENQVESLISIPLNPKLISELAELPILDEDVLFELSTQVQSASEAVEKMKSSFSSSFSLSESKSRRRLTLTPHQIQLFRAISENKEKVVAKLLKEEPKLDLRMVNAQGYAPLHVAAAEGAKVIIRLLVEAGADIHQLTEEGESAIFVATKYHNFSAVKTLAKLGARVSQQTTNGQVPLDVANKKIATFLNVCIARETLEQMRDVSDAHDSSANLIVWSANMSVGVAKFDEDHKQIIDAINRLWHVRAEPDEQKRRRLVSALLNFLVHYTEFHFQAEEALFDKYGWSLRKAHYKMHQNLLKQVAYYVKLFESGQADVDLALLNFLQDWLITHILKEDKQYSEFLNKHGIH